MDVALSAVALGEGRTLAAGLAQLIKLLDSMMPNAGIHHRCIVDSLGNCSLIMQN
ncbi:MAG: hypothetical protein HC805_03585 [Alkalinema sp. RL_2_19]|nr:hypothetical protein [Alkalinema sp. RL_2_19]